MCSEILNALFVQQVENCGFVDWVDGEWADTAKNAISRFWGMYEEQKSARIDEKCENAKLLKELSDEKDKVEKKCTSMVQSVNKFIDDTSKSSREATLKDTYFEKNLKTVKLII